MVDSLKNIGEFTEKCTVLGREFLIQKLKQIERKRHIMVWHNCCAMPSNIYFMIMVSTMYDHAVYLRNNEYLQKYKWRINVQAAVKKPQVYVLERCPSKKK